MKYPKVVVKKSFSGFGLFAGEDIKKGKKIIQYIGRIISNEEADRNPNRYIFEIDRKRSIDGSPRYNTARYANHSCKPNAITASYEGSRHKIYIEARRTINKGEEITIDYGEEYTSVYIKKGSCRCSQCKPVFV
jgi:SET domain-containing protein